MTVKTVKKKQKHKSKGSVRTVTKTVKNDSFFNFFDPPAIPDDPGTNSRCMAGRRPSPILGFDFINCFGPYAQLLRSFLLGQKLGVGCKQLMKSILGGGGVSVQALLLLWPVNL